jgi:hypothetical protein
MKRPTCGHCPYWDPDDDNKHEGDDVGLCKRFPEAPRMLLHVLYYDKQGHPEHRDIGATHAIESQCVETYEFDWCGEHPEFPEYLAFMKFGAQTPVAPC